LLDVTGECLLGRLCYLFSYLLEVRVNAEGDGDFLTHFFHELIIRPEVKGLNL
jgi:hypothetical protein